MPPITAHSRLTVELRWSDGHRHALPDLLWRLTPDERRVLARACTATEHGALLGIDLVPAPAPHKTRCPSGGRPALTEALIVAAARAWLADHGTLPSAHSGDATRYFAHGQPEHWRTAHEALKCGMRGLPGGDTLSRLLQREGLQSAPRSQRLAVDDIWAAARAYHDQHGRWPSAATAGPVVVAGRTLLNWRSLDTALRSPPPFADAGSLSQLIQRRARAELDPREWPTGIEPLTEALIVDAARRHHARTGRWPTADSGDGFKDFGFTLKWMDVNNALKKGLRGLPRHSSLARLLEPLKKAQP